MKNLKLELTNRIFLFLMLFFVVCPNYGQTKTTAPVLQIKIKDGKVVESKQLSGNSQLVISNLSNDQIIQAPVYKYPLQVSLPKGAKFHKDPKDSIKLLTSIENPDSAVFDSNKLLLKIKTNYPPKQKAIVSSQVGATTTTIMSEGFEGVWPGTTGWRAYSGGTTDTYWDDMSYRSYSGSYSAWCAAGGTNSSTAGGTYKNNMNAWMVYGPFDLSDATSAILNYKLWYSTELNYDKISCYASINGTNYYGLAYSGNSGGWISKTFDLTNVYTLGNLCGKSQVWIAFNFTSDVSGVNEGAYIDDVQLQKTIRSLPDLQPTNIGLSSESWVVGSSITASLTEKNAGDDIAGSHYSQLYLSPTTDISADGSPLGSPIYFSSIASGSTQSNPLSFKVPEISDGTYYVGVIVDIYNNVTESNEANNIAYRNGMVSITHPELFPSISVSPLSLIINQPQSQSNFINSTNTNLSNNHVCGLKIPQEVVTYWQHNVKSLRYNEKTLAASIDWSINDSPVKDQGSCGSCWAFSTLGLIENLSSIKYDLAEQTLISCVTASDGCNSGWYGYALEYINTYGVPPETCHPYSQTNGNCSDRCSNPDFLIKLTNFNKYGQWGTTTSSTVNDLKALLNISPVLVSMNVPSDGSFNNYKTGVYHYTGGSFSGGGHAVEVVGYNDTERWFKVKNSWGGSWGENGYFRISYDDVIGYVHFGGYACTASGIVKIDNNTNSFTISNTGEAELTVSSMIISKPWLSISLASVPFNVRVGQSVTKNITVNWSLLSTSSDTATISILSNDPNDPIVMVTITANKILSIPTISTNIVTAITSSTATSGGVISDDGGAEVTSRGVCWSLSPNPTVANSKTINGSDTGAFVSNISGLSGNKTYHVRAYATNSVGTAYGDDIIFDTPSDAILPTVYTSAITAITSSTATSGGVISDDGGAEVTSRGVCWSLSPNPTVANSKTTNGSDTGAFVSNISGLSGNKTYHVRAYATNLVGTAYGDDIIFDTPSDAILPTVYTSAIAAITSSTATSGGVISNDGGANVTSRGVCWSLSPNPTITGNKTTDGSGTGSFVSSILGLSGNKTYHVRAYATNSAGTAYGDDIVFDTPLDIVLPTVFTSAVSSITNSTATSGGIVTDDGGGTITDRGVCWDISPNPTIASPNTKDGSGKGAFASSITGLLSNKTYHIRAYATNVAGTAYGIDISFNTITSGTEDITNSEFEIYPNPTCDEFQITGVSGKIMLGLLDLNGRLLLSKNVIGNENISVHSLPQGLYIVRITTANGIIEKKLVKK